MRAVPFEPESSSIGPRFPRRPNLRILSESIPLFYVCQNRHGFWIAREAEGRTGGLFLRKQSALRFAQRKSAPTGCAIMQLSEPAELDVENKGSRIAAPLGRLVNVTMQRAPRLAAFFGMMIAEWHKLVTQISAPRASRRKHRVAAERELFHGEYWLSTKDDDDLPIYEFSRSPFMDNDNDNDNEPPSGPRSPIFLIGQDSSGNWVVQDRAGRRGGLFVNRAEALRYIRLESARQALVIGAASLELELSAAAIVRPEPRCGARRERRVA